MTVNELYKEYIAAKKHEVRESTLDKNIQIIEIHILPLLGNTKINKLNVQTIQEWKRSINEGNYKIRTKQLFYKVFRALLNFGVKMEYIPTNPLLRAGNFKAPAELHKEMQYYTTDEFKKFISAARETAEHSGTLLAWNLYIFFFIAFFTGMRKGEINALTWNDIINNEIHVTKSVAQKSKGEDRITPPKNKSSIRNIGIPEPLKIVLDEHYNRCKTMQGFNDDYYVCGGIRPLRDTVIEEANLKYASRAEIKHIRIHDFRHSHASYLANNGINIMEIARRLGHSDIKTTLQTYSHLYPKESERTLSVLNSITI